MTKNELATLVFRVVAIFVFMQAARFTGWLLELFIYSAGEASELVPKLVKLVPFAVLLGLGTALWIKANVLARKVFPSSQSSIPVITVTSAAVLRICLALWGISLIFYGAVGLISSISAVVLWQGMDVMKDYVLHSKWSLITLTGNLIAGLILLFQPRWLLSLLRKTPVGKFLDE